MPLQDPSRYSRILLMLYDLSVEVLFLVYSDMRASLLYSVSQYSLYSDGVSRIVERYVYNTNATRVIRTDYVLLLPQDYG